MSLFCLVHGSTAEVQQLSLKQAFGAYHKRLLRREHQFFSSLLDIMGVLCHPQFVLCLITLFLSPWRK